MFNLSLKLKDQKKPCTPVGPAFSKAKKVKTLINGSVLQVKVPAHRASSAYEPCDPKSSYDLTLLNIPYANPQDQRLRGISILRRTWDFYGPMFTGRKASCFMNVTLCSSSNRIESENYFHPKAFEKGVSDILTYEFESDKLSGVQNWLAPSEWSPIYSYDCIAAKFKVLPNTHNKLRRYYVYFMMPVLNSYIVSFSFEVSWSGVPKNIKNTEDKKAEWIDTSEVQKLIDDVINSVNFELSPLAEGQMFDAKNNGEKAKVSMEFSPIKWS